jgi:hypothetical protein
MAEYYRKDITGDIFKRVVYASRKLFENKCFTTTKVSFNFKFPTWEVNYYSGKWTLKTDDFRELTFRDIYICRLSEFRKIAKYMRINFFVLRDYFFSMSLLAYNGNGTQQERFKYQDIDVIFKSSSDSNLLVFERRRIKQWGIKEPKVFSA